MPVGGPSGRLDVHHHFAPPPYVEEMERRNVPLQPVLRNWTVDRSLADMARGGVTSAVLSITAPGFFFGDASAAGALVRTCNEAGAALTRSHPGVLGLFAAVPMPDVEGTLAEIAYALDALHADGIALFTSYGRRWLGDASFAPVLAELDRRGVVAFVHPIGNACCTGLVPGVPDSVVEYGTDTSRTIASLLFGGAAARYRRIRFIFCHAGGSMPFMIERFAMLGASPAMHGALPFGAQHELVRFFYDTAQSSNLGAMSSLRQLVPPAQILFGTDYPFRSAGEYVGALERCGFDAAALAQIGRGNAERLMPSLRAG
ncbi:MAG TPA: amidohydrolase family protein [Candidatus Sulfotelmatobacter sp.]|nr:amidohydrolase family protein [Candidatus Sulfotelmatobacter sp.]